MTKPGAGSTDKPEALFLTAEAPYPMVGGGPLRTGSLLEYLASRYTLDVVVFRQPGAEDPAQSFPAGLARKIEVLDLPYHSKSTFARAGRNITRYVRGAPPLLDRFSAFTKQLPAKLGGRQYELGVIEHAWCALYLHSLRPQCRRVVLDLHNIESELQSRNAASARWPLSAMFRRFASVYRELEQQLLPRCDMVLVASEDDQRKVQRLSPDANVQIFPNALPYFPVPVRAEQDCIAFTGNLEYQPNVAAVRFFRDHIWPLLRERWRGLEWRLVGTNPNAVAGYVERDRRIRVVGPVDNAVQALAEAKVAVVPLLAGSGTRFKILEAWAAATPVVSTSVGAEGLGARGGEHLLLADDPVSFADAVSRLLESSDLRAKIGREGRTLYLEQFTWEVVWRQLEQLGL